jgi:hypothetical protein
MFGVLWDIILCIWRILTGTIVTDYRKRFSRIDAQVDVFQGRRIASWIRIR